MVSTSASIAFFDASLRYRDLDFPAARFRKKFFEFLALFEIRRDVNRGRECIAASEVDLLQQRLEKIRRIETVS